MPYIGILYTEKGNVKAIFPYTGKVILVFLPSESTLYISEGDLGNGLCDIYIITIYVKIRR